MKTIRIRAVDDRLAMLVDDENRVRNGRFAGRDRERRALPDGEEVRDCEHYRRLIRRGDLELVSVPVEVKP